MREKGIVTEVDGEKAVVVITRHSACKKCDRDCGLSRSGHESEQMKVEVENPINARQGEEVMVEMESNRLYQASLILYAFPIISMILGYIVFNWLGSLFAFEQLELFAMAGAALFFALSWIIIRRIDNHFASDQSFKSRIIKRSDRLT